MLACKFYMEKYQHNGLYYAKYAFIFKDFMKFKIFPVKGLKNYWVECVIKEEEEEVPKICQLQSQKNA